MLPIVSEDICLVTIHSNDGNLIKYTLQLNEPCIHIQNKYLKKGCDMYDI